MTPEELQRTIEFIIASQARLAAAQEQDRQDRVQFEGWSKELFEDMRRTDDRLAQWSERSARWSERLAQLSVQLVQLTDHQSERMDYYERQSEKLQQQNERFHQEVLDLQRQALHLLNLILDRFPTPPRKPN
jgi:hypothetical protein